MLRFTIRDVLWLTVVVAVSLGWWDEHRKFAAYYKLVTSHIRWTPAGGGVSSISPDEPDQTSN